MPKIPLYQYQVEPSESTKPFMKEPDTQVGQAMEVLGTTALNMADRMIKERGVVEAGEAAQRLNDEEREFWTKESQKQGSAAFGAVQRGNEFYEDAVARHGQNLGGYSAEVYQKTAMNMRASGLDRLASHEVQQGDVAKKNVIAGNTARLQQRIAEGASEGDVLNGIAENNAYIRNAYIGVDTTAIEAKEEQEALHSLLVEKGKSFAPNDFNAMLEKYRDKLPEDKIEQLRKYNEQNFKDQMVDTEMVNLKSKFGANYEAMYKSVDSMKLPETVKSAIRTRIKDDFHTANAMEEKRKKDYVTKVDTDLATLWGQNNYAEVRKQAARLYEVDPIRAKSWIDAADSKTKELKKEGESLEKKSDPTVLAHLTALVHTYPQEIENTDILNMISTGRISEKDGIALMGTLKTNRQKKDDELSTVLKMVDADEKKGKFRSSIFAFSSTKKQENLEGAAFVRKSIIDYRRNYPDKDLRAFYDTLVKDTDLKDMKAEFNRLKQSAGEPTGIYAPQKTQTAQTQQQLFELMVGLRTKPTQPKQLPKEEKK